MNTHDLVVAMTGASGVSYGIRLLQILAASGRRVHLTISSAAVQVLAQELDCHVDLQRPSMDLLLSCDAETAARIVYHHYMDFRAGIASGSFPTAGMVVCPCSMGTAAAIAHGHSQNLIHRAADVHLKERRTLILVPRETPLSAIHLRNLTICAENGAVVLPAMPAFYTKPRNLNDMIDFVVGRICDQLGVDHQLIERWGS